ncbi:MAG: Vitamin B12 dependent methionine synthase activation subunit [Desulfosporosinus sp.]|nr:Vitamin B12 dependent methionine synthase activation subunit [Desulfosporosinus sp.]
MTESVVQEIPLPEVTLEEVFRAEGADYSKRPPRPSVVEIHNQVLRQDAKHVRPVLIWREFAISGAEEQELFLEKGPKLKSSLLVKVAGRAEKLVLLAMTIGSALDNAVADYNQAGKILESFALDAAGSIFLAKSIMLVIAELEDKYKVAGMSTTFLLGPGHSYWSGLDDVRTIIETLKAEQIGITLTDSNLMIPRKSVAMVMGVGHNLPDFKGKTHCDFCSLQKTCNMNKFAQNCGG